jgi:hypothetical protein
MDRYDPDTSRLTDGRLLPEPDYVFCAMGTNDYAGSGDNITLPTIKDAYTEWVKAVRKACPHALIFCVVRRWGGTGRNRRLVAVCNQGDDGRVFLIDTPTEDWLQHAGGHGVCGRRCAPSVYGNATLGALIAVEAQKHWIVKADPAATHARPRAPRTPLPHFFGFHSRRPIIVIRWCGPKRRCRFPVRCFSGGLIMPIMPAPGVRDVPHPRRSFDRNLLQEHMCESELKTAIVSVGLFPPHIRRLVALGLMALLDRPGASGAFWMRDRSRSPAVA